MDVLIIDDEMLARQRLVRLLGKIPGYQVVAEAGDADTALAAMAEFDPDIVLCDISMPGGDGLQLAARLAQLEDAPALIFCTAYDQFALEAFAVQALDYLLKPVAVERLQAALDKASRVNRVQRQMLTAAPAPAGAVARTHISASSRRGVTLIPLQAVQYFLADQKYVTVCHDGGEHLLDESLKELESELGAAFIRVHRNALVAAERIESLQRTPQGLYQLLLRGATRPVTVSRRHAGPLREWLARR